ncbi:DNA ligase 1 isoform X2 [Cardiocondyla obscurior]|uniref:DNA ligase 1 isoform X2 n=1 Tax=Cardiocondyla obscurior TaxID=286306 RepID=UPI003965747B
MKSKVDKKGRKRSFSETSVPKKLNQKQEDSNEFKKGGKKGKFANVKQNGHSISGEKAAPAPIEVVNKQKQNKAKPQSSNVIKAVQTKKDPKKKTNETAVKKESNFQKKRSKRVSIHKRGLSVEEMREKIEEIRSRDHLSKRAKRMLSVLNRKLKSSDEQVKKVNTIDNKNNKKLLVRNILLSKQKANNANKIKVDKKPAQKKIKELQDEDESNSEVDSDNEESLDDESVSDESEVEGNEKKRIQKPVGSVIGEGKIKSLKKVKKDDEEDEEDIDSDIDEEELESEMDEEELESEEDEELESGEDEEGIESEDDEEQIESDDDDEDEDDDDEDEGDAENIKKFEKAILELKKDNLQKKIKQEQNKSKQEQNKNKQEQNKNKQEQNKNKQTPQSLNNQQKKDDEKKGIVLFVGNLPTNVNI